MRALMRRSDRGVLFPMAYLAAATFAAVAAAFSTVIASSSDGISALPATATGVGATAAVSLAVFIAKKLLSGEITPLPITKLVETNQKIIERLEARDSTAERREAEFKEIVKGATEAMFAIHDHLRAQQGAPPRPANTPTTTPNAL